jgi:sRNA-binding carbon storage regulator CsrA
MTKTIQELRVGESITFDNGRITIVLLEKSGKRARIEINAKEDVTINFKGQHNDIAAIAKGGINLPNSMNKEITQ